MVGFGSGAFGMGDGGWGFAPGLGLGQFPHQHFAWRPSPSQAGPGVAGRLPVKELEVRWLGAEVLGSCRCAKLPSDSAAAS